MRLRQTADQLIPELAGLQQRFLIGGIVFLAISAIGYVMSPDQFFQGYLMAYMLALGATVGSLAVAMIHQLSGGKWGVVIRRILGAGSRVLPVMTVLFIPIIIGIPHLYHWASPEAAHDEVLQVKQLYLNVPFFIGRAAFYFLVWNTLAYLLNKWSLQQDQSGDPAIAKRMERLSAGGLLIFGLTMTFAAFDWLMSLDPHWYSTIYGFLVLGGQGLTTMALTIIALNWLSKREPMNVAATPQYFHDLANLMLAFVILWAYFSFSQYMIIYAANLPEEITFYTRRLDTSWNVVGQFLIVAHFVVPFFILLFRRNKRSRRSSCSCAWSTCSG
jgi:MFS family permease